MFFDTVFNDPKQKLDQLLETIKSSYNIDLSILPYSELRMYARKYEGIKNKIISESKYNSYNSDPEYSRAILITEAIKLLIEIAPKRKKSKPHRQFNEEIMKSPVRTKMPINPNWAGKKTMKESAWEKDLDEKAPVKVTGVRGVKSVPFTRKFPNLKAAQKWMDKEEENITIHRVMNESRRFYESSFDDNGESLDQAETLLAAKDLSDRLQKMAEDAAKMAVDDLMPLVDTMKSQFGQESANGFNDVVKKQLQLTLDTIIKAKDETDNAILDLQNGRSPSMSSDISDHGNDDLGLGGDDEPHMDLGKDDDDENFAATPSRSGPLQEPLGRARKEIAEARLKNRSSSVAEARRSFEKKKTCTKCKCGVYEETKGKMKCNECGHQMMEEAWKTEMHTSKKDVGMWDGWSLAKLKKEKERLMSKPKRTAAEQTKVKQLNFAIRAKQQEYFGKIKEDVQNNGQPSADDYSTDDLENAMKTGKTSDGKPVDRTAAQNVLNARKTAGSTTGTTGTIQPTVTEGKRKKANPYAIDMAKAEKETGDTPPLKKSTIKRAHEIAKGIKEELKSRTAVLENLHSQYTTLQKMFQLHKKQFKQQVMEGKQTDVMKVGYGLEGDAILEKLKEVKSKLSDAIINRKIVVEFIKETRRSINEAKKEIKIFDKQLDSSPYGVVGINEDGKKVKMFFESIDQRSMWLNFHKNSLQEHQLIDPSTIQKAQSYIKNNKMR